MNETNLLIAVITVGVALAGLILTSNRGLRQDMKQMEARLEGQISAQISGVRGEVKNLRGEVNGLREEITGLRERMSHLEGLLEGLREAISGRAAAR